MKYSKLLFVDNVCIQEQLDDGSMRFFNENEDNPHYVAYLEWIAEGNTPEEITPEV